MIRIIIKKREKELPYAYSSTIVILASIFLSLVVLSFFGINPMIALWEAFVLPILTVYGWANILYNGLILLLCGVGLVIAFKAGVWNIGAEGQMLMGAIAATWVSLYLIPEAPSIVMIPSMFIVGFLFGALWGFIAGVLKAKLGVNEVLTTMMLNYIAYQIVYYLVMGPWANPATSYPVSKPFPEQAWLLSVSRPLPVSVPTLILALTIAPLVHLMLFRTKLGYEIRAIGSNPIAAKTYGISYAKAVIISMLLSGGLAGLAGVHAVAGSILTPQLRRPEQVSRGFGFVAILVAWLSGIKPLPVIFMSILMGLVFLAGFAIQISFARGIGSTHLFTGVMLLILSIMETYRRYEISVRIHALRRILRWF
ncbi:MAG: ABC transporter permease [Candidatus Korarchaeota archaeon]|nr:ABC transporter permease [Thermoproteota archaeon]MCR8501746.1 ABC transporter permease [Thermoproteota archaeon]